MWSNFDVAFAICDPFLVADNNFIHTGDSNCFEIDLHFFGTKATK